MIADLTQEIHRNVCPQHTSAVTGPPGSGPGHTSAAAG
jgi:hypothetical protein